MKWSIFVLAGALNASVFAQTNQTVVPSGFANQGGNAGNGLLFVASNLQQLYRGSSLEPAWPTAVKITGVSFRVEAGDRPYNSVVPQIEIRLSTSSMTPEQMTSNYSVNRGTDETTVYLHNDVALTGAGNQQVNPFDLHLNFDKSFLFDSKAGNLLMYIQTGQANPISGASGIDAQTFPSLAVSPVAAVGSSTIYAANFVGPYGVVAEFSWVAVPEPSVRSLLVTTGCVFLPPLLLKRR